MRLTKHQIESIIEQAKNCFGDAIRLYLFGSRVDDTQKGGDIDLLIESNEEIESKLKRALEMNANLQLAIGEQKIDILVFDTTNTNKLFRIAKNTGVVLYNGF